MAKRAAPERPYETVGRAVRLEGTLSLADRRWLAEQREQRKFIVKHGHLPGEGSQARMEKATSR